MAMIACPSCGLPRDADAADTTPCPVCAAGPNPVLPAGPRPRPAVEADPPLPSDASQLAAHATTAPSGHRPAAVLALFAFALGAVAASAVHSALTPPPADPDPANRPPVVAQVVPPPPTAPTTVVAEPPPPKAKAVQPPEPELAPPPHEPAPPPAVAAAPPGPRPAVLVEMTQPNLTLYAPPLNPGETAVLRGKARVLRVSGAEDGTTYDASGLTAEHITIGGKVGDGAVIKVATGPRGFVTVYAPLGRGARLEVVAPDGEVVFGNPNGSSSATARVDHGARVSVTARKVEIKGDIRGENTRVLVTLAAGGVLRAKAVCGPAVLEYRKANPDDPAPSLDVKQVDASATFRRADD